MKTKTDLVKKIVGAIYKCETDPNHPDNQDKDFQDGFETGLRTYGKSEPNIHPITTEWLKRGCPEKDNSFKRWKIGYYVGRFTMIEKQ